MEKILRLTQSPFTPPIQTVGNLIINLHVPYSDKEVTIQINPNYQQYIEDQKADGIEIKQFSVTTSTIDTMQFKFDFEENNSKTFNYDDETYTLRLIQIGNEKIEGQDFRFFEFEVKWVNSAEKTGGSLEFELCPYENENNPVQYVFDIGDSNNLNSKRVSVIIDEKFNLIFRLIDLDGKIFELLQPTNECWKPNIWTKVIYSWDNELIRLKLIRVKDEEIYERTESIKELRTFHFWEKPPIIIGANLEQKQNAKMGMRELKVYSLPILK